MSYFLLRVKEGWITNDTGDFYVENTEQKCRMWIPNNLIAFNENNQPHFKNQENDNVIKPIKVVDISHEFKETSKKNVTEGSNENVFHFEGEERNNVTEIEVVPSTSIKEKKIWTIDETRALIAAVEARYDDMHHVQKRKHFWSIISEELCSQNIECSDVACKKKWLNLVRTYKNAKDIKSRTGRGPVKFTFYDRLDELLGDSPSNASPHSIDVDAPNSKSSFEEPSCSSSESSLKEKVENKKTRRNPSLKLVKVKTKFFEDKMEKNKEKEVNRKLYVEESLKYQNKKLDLYKEKLEIEKEKVKVLGDLQKILKERNT